MCRGIGFHGHAVYINAVDAFATAAHPGHSPAAAMADLCSFQSFQGQFCWKHCVQSPIVYKILWSVFAKTTE